MPVAAQQVSPPRCTFNSLVYPALVGQKIDVFVTQVAMFLLHCASSETRIGRILEHIHFESIVGSHTSTLRVGDPNVEASCYLSASDDYSQHIQNDMTWRFRNKASSKFDIVSNDLESLLPPEQSENANVGSRAI